MGAVLVCNPAVEDFLVLSVCRPVESSAGAPPAPFKGPLGYATPTIFTGNYPEMAPFKSHIPLN